MMSKQLYTIKPLKWDKDLIATVIEGMYLICKPDNYYYGFDLSYVGNDNCEVFIESFATERCAKIFATKHHKKQMETMLRRVR